MGISYPVSSVMAQSQEICDNAIDDDGNGLIDLNDPQCDCGPAEPPSLVPNPSFEDTNCCPTNNSQLYCSTSWIQASEATTDFYHRCGYFMRYQFTVPLPLPDGDAYIGFRNGRYIGNGNPNWKEYTGACLISPLEAGTPYTFRFHIGFIDAENSPPMNVVLYGTSDCKNLPFGIGDQEFGCPTNGPNWRRLGSVKVGGDHAWIPYQINTTPTENITAIAIGPDCDKLNITKNPYYFLDKLVLATTELFGPDIRTIDHPCSNDFTLRTAQKANTSYQWYKDGVAIVGATSTAFTLDRIEGSYQVLTKTDTSCILSDAYDYTIPKLTGTADIDICPGGTYSFAGEQLANTGTYSTTVQTRNGCDSTITLNLTMLSELRDTVEAYFFDGDAFNMGPYNLYSPTETELRFVSSLGCDSIVQLTLKEYPIYIPNAFSPNDDGINDTFQFFGEEGLISVESLVIYDRWGNRVFQQKDVDHFEWDGNYGSNPVNSGIYMYLIELTVGDGERKVLSGDLMVVR